MFEKEIKFIADFNLNKVKSFGSFITFERLLNSSLHPAVIQYISAELDYLISEDRKRLLGESVFDYSGVEAAKYFGLIAQEIKKSKEISFEDLKKLVIQAVSFNLNFLARPKWSLSKLIYNEEQNRSIEEIKLNLSYIYYYDYIKNIFLSYISKRKLTTLSITEFELILNKIDNELFATQPQKLIDYSLYSMAEFFNLGDVSKTKISVFTLELFLKEKNLMDYLFRLRKAVPEDTIQKYDIEDIKNIIYSSAPIDVRPVKPEEKVPEKEIPQKNEEVLPEDKEDDLFLPLKEENETVLPEDIPAEESIAEEIIEEKAEEEIVEETTEQEIDDKIEEQIIEEEIVIVEEKVNEEITEQNNEDEINEEEIIEELVEEDIGEEIAEELIEGEIAEEQVEEIIEPAEKIEVPEIEELENEGLENIEPENEELEIEEPPAAEIADEEKAEPITDVEDKNITPETDIPEEEIKIEDINDDAVDTLTNEEFFSLFSEEVKNVEESDPDLKPEAGTLKDETEKKDDPDSFFDFEEETENLLRAFKETEEELNSKGIDLFQDTSSKTEKAAMDLINDFHNESNEKDNTAPPAKENNNSKPVKKAGKYKEKKIKNILDSISNNDIEKIIFNVFNDDKKDFADTMEKLNECANYDEATEILKSVFLTYRINPYTKDALTLTNSVANYFTRI